MTQAQTRPREESGLDENVVRIYRCATVVKGGRRFSFSALMVVGDRQGSVGVGYGKATEVPSAVDKARKIATRNLRPIRLAGNTIPHRVVGQFGSSRVVMVPASPGTGVIAGVHDVLTKAYGSTSPKNLVRATFVGLASLLDPEEVEQLRGVKLAG